MRDEKKTGSPLPIVFPAVVALAAIGAWYFSAPTQSPRPAAATPSQKLAVTASFYPVAFFAERVGGDKADVFDVTPAGAEPHDYEPTSQDAARIESSDVLFLNGGGLEPWADAIRKNLDPRRTLVMTTGEGLTSRQVEEEGKTTTDPHVWLSPFLAQKMVDRIVATYDQVDPADRATFDGNAAALKADLAALDAEYKGGLAHCARRELVTSHAAFGYLAAQYGLDQVAIAGLSPNAEPSLAQLADIAALARRKGVRYVFFERLVSPKLSDTMAMEVGAKTLTLDPLEGIAPADRAAGKDYFTEMRANLANLKLALACTP